MPNDLPIPSAWDPEIAFISNVASNATVAAISYGAWSAFSTPPPILAQYNATNAFATKWGSTILSTSGTPGGLVTYRFDPASDWSASEKDAWVAALALWQAEVNITFVEGGPGANLTFYRQPNPLNPDWNPVKEGRPPARAASSCFPTMLFRTSVAMSSSRRERMLSSPWTPVADPIPSPTAIPARSALLLRPATISTSP